MNRVYKIAGVSLAFAIGASSARAQDADKPNVVPQEKGSTRRGEPIGTQLNRSDGVIKPPVDPSFSQRPAEVPTPNPNTTPNITPPPTQPNAENPRPK